MTRGPSGSCVAKSTSPRRSTRFTFLGSEKYCRYGNQSRLDRLGSGLHVGTRRCNRDAFKTMSGPILYLNESHAARGGYIDARSKGVQDYNTTHSDIDCTTLMWT